METSNEILQSTAKKNGIQIRKEQKIEQNKYVEKNSDHAFKTLESILSTRKATAKRKKKYLYVMKCRTERKKSTQIVHNRNCPKVKTIRTKRGREVEQKREKNACTNNDSNGINLIEISDSTWLIF